MSTRPIILLDILLKFLVYAVDRLLVVAVVGLVQDNGPPLQLRPVDGSKLERGPIALDKPDDGDEKTIDSID